LPLTNEALAGAFMTWPFWLAQVLCLMGGAAVGLVVHGSRRWTEASRSLTARLEAGRVSTPSLRYDSGELEGLPAPVQRYFRAVLKEGQPIIAGATIEVAGTFNLSVTGEHWKAFTSRQRIVTRQPGFLWDARVFVLPGVAVRIVDGYIAGEGLLRAAVLGLFTVADIHGGGEIARGELMRFFAEMAWYPTALLPSQGVRWDALDEASANATIVDGPLTLSLLFRFNDAGLIESARAEARGAMVGKEMVMVPWEGSWSNYQSRDGMIVPITGEAAWLRPEGRKPYFHGSVTATIYEFFP
jgi:hypothetical protein